MKKHLWIAAFLSVFVFGGAASAENVECEFTDWKGTTTDDIAISWVGIGFIADTSTGELTPRGTDGFYKTVRAEIVRSENFTGFVYYLDETADNGELYRNRYSYRIYKSGKCEGRVDDRGFSPLVAIGRIK